MPQPVKSTDEASYISGFLLSLSALPVSFHVLRELGVCFSNLQWMEWRCDSSLILRPSGMELGHSTYMGSSDLHRVHIGDGIL